MGRGGGGNEGGPLPSGSPLVYLWGLLRRVPYWCNGKSLERGGSYTGEVVLCSGLVNDCRVGLSQRDMEPFFMGRRQKAIYRLVPAPQSGTPNYTMTFDPILRR